VYNIQRQTEKTKSAQKSCNRGFHPSSHCPLTNFDHTPHLHNTMLFMYLETIIS